MRFILSFVVVCFVVVGINAASAQTPREQQEYRRLEQAAWELRLSRGPEEAADSLSHLAGVLEAAYAEYAAAEQDRDAAAAAFVNAHARRDPCASARVEALVGAARRYQQVIAFSRGVLSLGGALSVSASETYRSAMAAVCGAGGVVEGVCRYTAGGGLGVVSCAGECDGFRRACEASYEAYAAMLGEHVRAIGEHVGFNFAAMRAVANAAQAVTSTGWVVLLAAAAVEDVERLRTEGGRPAVCRMERLGLRRASLRRLVEAVSVLASDAAEDIRRGLREEAPAATQAMGRTTCTVDTCAQTW